MVPSIMNFTKGQQLFIHSVFPMNGFQTYLASINVAFQVASAQHCVLYPASVSFFRIASICVNNFNGCLLK